MSEEIQIIDSAFLDDISKDSGLTNAMGIIMLLMVLLAIGTLLGVKLFSAAGPC